MPGKKKKKEESEESELEEEIEEVEKKSEEEEAEEFEEEIGEEFSEFLQSPPSRWTSPVLRQAEVSTQPRIIDLEDEIPASSGTDEKKKDDGSFKYLAGAEKSDEPKYIDMGGKHVTGVTHADVMSLGRGELFERQKMSFTPTESGMESSNVEKYVSPERFEIEKAGKGNTFEKQNLKYTPSREY